MEPCSREQGEGPGCGSYDSGGACRNGALLERAGREGVVTALVAAYITAVMEPCSREQGEGGPAPAGTGRARCRNGALLERAGRGLAGDGGCELPKREPLRTSPS